MNILQLLFGKSKPKKPTQVGKHTYLFRITYTVNGHRNVFPTYAKSQKEAKGELMGTYPDAVICEVYKSKQTI